MIYPEPRFGSHRFYSNKLLGLENAVVTAYEVYINESILDYLFKHTVVAYFTRFSNGLASPEVTSDRPLVVNAATQSQTAWKKALNALVASCLDMPDPQSYDLSGGV